MTDLAVLLQGMSTIAGRGDVEAALRCARELLSARHSLELGRKLRQRSILLLADCAELRADIQLGRGSAEEIKAARAALQSRAEHLLAEVCKFATAEPQRISKEEATRTAIFYQQAIDSSRGAREQTAASIFISYRRADSAEITGFIAQHLLSEFGEGSIFMDVDSIPVGVNYRAFIVSTLAKCKACLVVIGPDWLDMRDDSGGRRIDVPDDLVRVEVETALRIGVPVAPILVRGAEVPAASQLPSSISELSSRNGLNVRPPPDFNSDIARLAARLKEQLG